MIDQAIVGQGGKPIALIDTVTSSWHVYDGGGGGMDHVRQVGGRIIPVPEPVHAAPPVTRQPVQRMPPRTVAPAPAAPRFPPPPDPSEDRAMQTIGTGTRVRHCTACGAAGHYANSSKCPKSPTYDPRKLTMNQRLNNRPIEQRLQSAAEVCAERELAEERAEERELAAVSAEPGEMMQLAAAIGSGSPAPTIALQCALCGRTREQSRAFVRSENGNAVCTTCVLESLRLFVDAQITSERPVLTLTLER